MGSMEHGRPARPAGGTVGAVTISYAPVHGVTVPPRPLAVVTLSTEMDVPHRCMGKVDVFSHFCYNNDSGHLLRETRSPLAELLVCGAASTPLNLDALLRR